MNETTPTQGWWKAIDGRWYPPVSVPSTPPTRTPRHARVVATGSPAGPPQMSPFRSVSPRRTAVPAAQPEKPPRRPPRYWILAVLLVLTAGSVSAAGIVREKWRRGALEARGDVLGHRIRLFACQPHHLPDPSGGARTQWRGAGHGRHSSVDEKGRHVRSRAPHLVLGPGGEWSDRALLRDLLDFRRRQAAQLPEGGRTVCRRRLRQCRIFGQRSRVEVRWLKMAGGQQIPLGRIGNGTSMSTATPSNDPDLRMRVIAP